MNTLWANVIVAGINQGHSLWERWQLGDVIFSNHHLLQFRQTHKSSVLNGCYLVVGQVNPLQFVWRKVGKHIRRNSFFIVTPTFKFAFGSELILMCFYSKWKHTHGGKVRLVDLFDSVVASIEVSGVFGERGHTIQIQVIAVDWTTKACAQQANGHTWNTWTRRRKTEKGRQAIVAC